MKELSRKIYEVIEYKGIETVRMWNIKDDIWIAKGNFNQQIFRVEGPKYEVDVWARQFARSGPKYLNDKLKYAVSAAPLWLDEQGNRVY